MRKKKEPVILQNIEIESIAAEGNALAHVEGKVLFVPWCIPGDIVDVRVTKKKSAYMEGVMQRIVTPSPLRLEPFCKHYTVCGGCKWQPLPYDLQLKYKQQQVEDQLKRIGKLVLPPIEPILGSEKTVEYRNKLEFTFSNKRWILSGEDAEGLSDVEKLGLGFHISGFFDKVLDIKKCHLQASPSNEIRLWIKQYAIDNGLSFFDLREQTGLLRNLVIRTASTGEVMVIVVFACESEHITELMEELKNAFPQINSLYYIVNTKRNDSISDQTPILFSGSDAIYEQMEDLKFKIGPKSFYQTNSLQAYRLYSVVREFADLKGNEIVYDLYTGTGTIGLFLSNNAAKVVGIEYVPEAIEDAKVNASNNGRANAFFFAGDMKDMLTGDFINENGKPDVVILDPPRAGIHPSVAEVLLQAQAPRMVYVSCNPATQARDLALLQEKYEITRVRPVDMFPHTHHVENVVALKLRG
ncbi:MAG: 23S rRNA (uracil(1939)-C(5))-methyltransferase RlmD [Bacteroidales bacterium]|nr:23S rRNA (uracil(1939)-C(5))-methyltransferase RlmD [Bacteroidales bacterium]